MSSTSYGSSCNPVDVSSSSIFDWSTMRQDLCSLFPKCIILLNTTVATTILTIENHITTTETIKWNCYADALCHSMLLVAFCYACATPVQVTCWSFHFVVGVVEFLFYTLYSTVPLLNLAAKLTFTLTHIHQHTQNR